MVFLIPSFPVPVSFHLPSQFFNYCSHFPSRLFHISSVTKVFLLAIRYKFCWILRQYFRPPAVYRVKLYTKMLHIQYKTPQHRKSSRDTDSVLFLHDPGERRYFGPKILYRHATNGSTPGQQRRGGGGGGPGFLSCFLNLNRSWPLVYWTTTQWHPVPSW